MKKMSLFGFVLFSSMFVSASTFADDCQATSTELTYSNYYGVNSDTVSLCSGNSESNIRVINLPTSSTAGKDLVCKFNYTLADPNGPKSGDVFVFSGGEGVVFDGQPGWSPDVVANTGPNSGTFSFHVATPAGGKSDQLYFTVFADTRASGSNVDATLSCGKAS